MSINNKATVVSDVPETAININLEVGGAVNVQQSLTVNKNTVSEGNLITVDMLVGKNFICLSDLNIKEPSTLGEVVIVGTGLKNNRKIINVGNPFSNTDLLNLRILQNLSPKCVSGSSFIVGVYVPRETYINWIPRGLADYHSPGAGEYISVYLDKIYLHKPGLYRISYAINRYRGENSFMSSGLKFNEMAGFVVVNLTSGGITNQIGGVDVRGWAQWSDACLSESLLFEIPPPGPSNNDTYVTLFSNEAFDFNEFTFSATWFPQNYK
ncbi:MAG: hypothetical protein RSB82_04770 [Victivallaceae bacterium]